MEYPIFKIIWTILSNVLLDITYLIVNIGYYKINKDLLQSPQSLLNPAIDFDLNIYFIQFLLLFSSYLINNVNLRIIKV